MASEQSLETLYVDIAARADQLVAQADVAVSQVIASLDAIEKKNKEVEGSFGKLGGFIQNALSVASGMALARLGGSLTQAVLGFGKSLIQTNAQMQMYEKTFENLTGSAEEAGKIIEWVKEQAKATPFDVPGLIQASQMLMTWGLDLKEWFTIVGDVAAGMNRPLSQVVNAVGTLASGQTGEAVRRFRDLGINLREFTDVLEFDAQGSLVTPLEEAIPVVKQIMEDRFGGMMAAQSRTWAGVISNMGDTWQQFVQVMGEPLFDRLNEGLVNLQAWIEENADAIEGFAGTLGEGLGAVVDLLGGIIEAFASIARWIEDIIGKVIGVPNWVKEGIQRGREIAGIVGGFYRAEYDVAGGLLAGESFDEALEGGREAWLETMNAIAGVTDAAAELDQKLQEVTEHQMAGYQAVKDRWEGIFEGMDERNIFERIFASEDVAAQGEALRFLDSLGLAADGAAEAFEQENFALLELNREYSKAVALSESLAKAKAAVAEQEARIREEQEANLELAQEIAAKLTQKLDKLVADYAATVEELRRKSEETIKAIEAEAAQAEADAIAEHQRDVAKMREDFAREQLRRRRQFNREWARLIRDQNQEVIDAEWEYEYAKRNLLIEGDEVALADLEARYAHEKDVRAREQQDARDDMQANQDAQEADSSERFETRLAEMQQRLEEEIQAIRAKAEEEARLERERLEESLAAEKAALDKKLEALGIQLAKLVGDNQYAADIVLAAWTAMYDAQVAAAVAAGLQVRADLDATTAAAVNAAAAVANVMAGYRGGPRTVDYLRPSGRMGRPRTSPPRPRRGYDVEGLAEGGYTQEGLAYLHNREFVSTSQTTRALEEALGGPLTQQGLQDMALRSDHRRRLEVNIDATGVPADLLEQFYDDLSFAMREAAEMG